MCPVGGTRDDTPKSHTRGSVKTFKIWRYHDDNGKSFGDATAHFLRIFLLKQTSLKRDSFYRQAAL